MDAVGKAVQLSSVQAEGRGVWVVDQIISECQISQPSIKLDEQNDFQDAKAVCIAMRKEWNGLFLNRSRCFSLHSLLPLLDEIKICKARWRVYSSGHFLRIDGVDCT